MTRLAERLFECEARIAGIFPLALGDPESAPEWLEDFAEYGAEATLAKWPSVARLLANEDESPSTEDLAEALFGAGCDGFLCKIEWCVRRPAGDASFYSGWGHTRFAWFYGETADEALEVALSHVEEQQEAFLKSLRPEVAL